MEVHHGEDRRRLHHTRLRAIHELPRQSGRKFGRALRALIRISSDGQHNKAVKSGTDERIAAPCGPGLPA